MRYGDVHLKQVYQSQIKNKQQKASESLQNFEVDVTRLVYLAAQMFKDGVTDYETAYSAFSLTKDANWLRSWISKLP